MIARKLGAAVAAAAAGVALLIAPAAASAQPEPAQEIRVMGVDCFVDVARANFRKSPDGEILGSVGRGQGIYAYDWHDGWYKGDLWGGERGVWMHGSVLGPPCGD